MESGSIAFYAEQVSLNSLVQNVVYASGTVGAILVVVGLLLIDAGTTRRKSLFNSTIEKVMGFFLGFTVYYIIGFGFWAGQYYIMVDATMMDSLNDWWIGGAMMNARAQDVDPAVFPGLNSFQIFVFFLACFAGIVNILFHFAVSERMKASAYYVFAVVAAVASSVLSWVTWGSVGPLTNAGFHDFFGVGFVYMFPAGMALVIVNMLPARPGVFEAHPRVPGYYAPSIGLAATGLMTVFSGLPMIIMSCLFFFDPEALAVSVTMRWPGPEARCRARSSPTPPGNMPICCWVRWRAMSRALRALTSICPGRCSWCRWGRRSWPGWSMNLPSAASSTSTS